MSLKILIVDDSKAIRSVIKKIVTISGYQIDQIREAVNGKDAMDILAQDRFNLIVTDLNMPEITGMELLNWLKNNETLKEIPVIIVSAAGNFSQKEEALKKGASCFVRKPFLPEEIRQAFYEVLGISGHGK